MDGCHVSVKANPLDVVSVGVGRDTPVLKITGTGSNPSGVSAGADVVSISLGVVATEVAVDLPVTVTAGIDVNLLMLKISFKALHHGAHMITLLHAFLTFQQWISCQQWTVRG